MPKYKLAIFDLDGTLSDSLPWFLRVVNSIADKHRFRRIEAIDFGAVCWGFAKPEALRQASPALVFERVADIARLI
jgi:phosphoglycolate phosphatase-like HAD superfamily hydrolase